MKILVAGVGNILRRDDGFGVEVVNRLGKLTLPADVHLLESGIGGVVLVQELQDGYDALIVVDLADHGRPPGTVMLIEPTVRDAASMSDAERHETLADMHLATPQQALVLAQALGVLPPRVLLVGCQPEDADGIGEELSPVVEAAVGTAVDEIRRHIDELVAAGDPG